MYVTISLKIDLDATALSAKWKIRSRKQEEMR